MKKVLPILAATLLLSPVLHAQTPATNAPAAKPAAAAATPAAPKAPAAPKPPEANPSYTPANYVVAVAPENIAPTASTQPQPNIEVEGQPRQSVGHPCTLLDKQDVDELKEKLKTNKDAQSAFARLKDTCDKRIALPLNVPIPQKNPDGTWMFPADFPANVSPYGAKLSHVNEGNAADIAALGMMYQLTGDEKYGEFARKMVLAYADGYNSYGHPKGWTEKNYRSAVDGRLTGQFLEDGFWLNEVAYGYDMIYSLPSFTPAEHAHVRDDLFKPIAAEFYLFADKGQDYISATHNRSCICTAGVLIAGYASEDQDMINTATYGVSGTKEAPTGGVFGTHFTEKCILPDGLWTEGSISYQTGIASCGLFNDAETLWHHGIDMYRFRDGALKRLIDSVLAMAYPTAKMTEPALHDGGSFDLVDDRNWLNNEVGAPYEFGYRRYRDPRYIPIINKADKTLIPTVHAGAPSLFLDLPSPDTIPPRPVESANFYSVGYGVLRVPVADGVCNQLLQEYGPSGGHSHPSKLGFDLFALAQPLMLFPGVIFPYNDPLDPKWFWTTIGNDAMSVDEGQQVSSGNIYKFPRGTPRPVAIQLVFGPASTMGIQRAWSNTIYPGIAQDRALFLTPQYVADIFGSFAAEPHKYDLAWHIVGDMTTTLKADPFTFDPAVNGLNAIENATHATPDKEWSATVTTPNGKPARFVAAGGTPTDVYLGTGPHIPQNPKFKPAAMILQRRADAANVIFANAVDISGDKEPYVKSVTQEGSLDAGYGLLKLSTVKGTDLCFSSYRPGTYKAGDLNTDAMQAMVQMDGTNVRALYLGGGTSLKVTGGAIARSAAGLAYVEKTDKGYIVANPSPAAATVTVTLSALKGLKAYNLDSKGKRAGEATTKSANGGIALAMKANTQVEFAK